MNAEATATIADTFEQWVRRSGDRLAVKDRDRAFSYDALNTAANRIARALMARDARPERPVGILVDDSALMVAAFLGVWKAGKIAVPLEPDVPPARMASMLRESAVETLLCDRHAMSLDNGVRQSGRPVVDVDAAAASGPDGDLALAIDPDSPALVCYTSGSTGTPRGVTSSHRFVLHRVEQTRALYGIGADDRHIALTTCRHGAGIFLVCRALLTGASVTICNLKAEGAAAVVRALSADAITAIVTMATVSRQLMAAVRPAQRFPDLRVVVISGEPISYRDLRPYRDLVSGDCRFINMISAAEVTLWAAHVLKPSDLDADGPVPIGLPHADCEIRLLDEHGSDVGPNQVGEVVARTRWVASGYWRRPDLTAAAFHVDPSASDQTLRIFRTGDLAKRRDDGVLIYMGRKDDQIKIRGRRVEPLEVELALADHPGIAECAVVPAADPRGDLRLVAHVRPRDGVALSPYDVDTHLRARLPDYLVPSACVIAESLPRTQSGKIDRRALPPVDWTVRSDRNAIAAPPRSATERTLVEIWTDLLRVDRIGIDDDFFRLGGDSLLAIQLVLRIEATLGRKLRSEALLEASTIARLAAAIDGPHARESAIVPIRSSGARRPFFCVPGVEGEPFSLRALARHMDEDQPFFALDATLLERDTSRPIPCTVVASYYVEAICTADPEGPYLVGGLSVGGVIAIEMARLLVEQGRRVACIALLDTHSPRGTMENASERFLNVVQELGLSPAQRVRAIRAVQAFRRHVCRWYAGRVDLFRLQEVPGPRDLGWSAYAADVHVHDVPGHHRSMTREPTVRHLAERLQSVIDRRSAEQGVFAD